MSLESSNEAASSKSYPTPSTSPQPVAHASKQPIQSSENGSDGIRHVDWLGQRPTIQQNSTNTSASLSASKMNLQVQQRRPSPSHVAALLAHQRAMSSQDVRLPTSKGSVRGYRPREATVAFDGTKEEKDTTTPGNTHALVNMYEARKNAPGPTQSVRYVSKPGPQIRSPRPLRPGLKSVASSSLLQDSRLSPSTTVNAGNNINSNTAATAARVADAPSYNKHQTGKKRAPEPPPPRRHGSLQSQASSIQPESMVLAGEVSLTESPTQNPTTPTESAGPSLLPARTMSSYNSAQSLPYLSLESTIDSTKSALQPSYPVNQSSATLNRSERPAIPSKRSGEPEASTSISHQMSVDSLANAIVASSLASSRASSPMKSAAAVTRPPHYHSQPQIQSHRLHLFHRNRSQEQVSRTPSPAKAMRTTMRGPAPSIEEERKAASQKHHRNRHLVRKHPNKHHEGDRKRYRTQITERERRRYEGVWAANRGLHVPAEFDDSATAVLNIVVREIWRRSRLGDEVLEEVWDLVSVRDRDRLSREEFVVGMWLIDQRLKGNKLPAKVSESVWGSVRRLEGIKLPKYY